MQTTMKKLPAGASITPTAMTLPPPSPSALPLFDGDPGYHPANILELKMLA